MDGSPLLTIAQVATPDLIRSVVGRTLDIDPARLDPTRSLALYGLDSLAAVELVAHLEDSFGQRLPEWLLSEHPTLAALSDALCGSRTGLQDELTIMQADSELPGDIRPDPRRPAATSPRHVLLTGATGFLGAFLLHELLEDPAIHVTCVVRPHGGDPVARVRRNLERYGLWHPASASRIDAVAGDLALDTFGLDVTRHDQLARSVDTIYHAGADVNWVQPYVALRHTNVAGTTALLRFACTGRPKPFHFVSSLSVCYATDGPPVVDEDVDMLPHVARLPLGYAQAKCVAEALVRQAAARGLPTRVYRPALIAGAAHTGASNVDDLIAALLKGCIQMGAAPDLDWTFDAVPVDYTARVIASAACDARHTSKIVHIRHPRPRHWRECVLWANVLGYRMRLQPFPIWQDQLRRQATCPGHGLYTLRPFFLRKAGGLRTVAELYEERTRSQVVDTTSCVALQAAGLECPALDADLLDRYFQDYVARGFLPDRPSSRGTDLRLAPPSDELQPLMRVHFDDTRLIVREARLVQAGSDRSVIGELTSWRRGRRTGLFHYDLEIERAGRRSSLDVMVKVKAADEEVLDVAETVAGMCDDRLAIELRRFRRSIGIRGSHVRELAIYEQDDARIRRHLPACYGTWRHDREASWGVVIEWLADMLLIDASGDTISWTTPHVAAAIDGLAALHSVWLGREQELCAQPWIGHVATAESAERMTPLWLALADHAAPRVFEWAGPDLVRTHRRLAETTAEWWPGLEALPRTLIHNDFNSRNVALRRTPAGPRLVAYDWELATVGAPQRDLAELLCFVLPEDASLETLNAWVERHRSRLEVESGIALPSGRWRVGFVSALAEFLVCRLSFYALIDRVTPQPFLPRVVRTWGRLHEVAASWSDGQ